MSDEKEIFEKAKTGCDKSIESIVLLYQSRLLKFCYFLCGDFHLAQDLSQETLLKLLKNLHTIKSEKAIYSWLIHVARNNFLDIKKSKFNSVTDISQQALENKGNHDLELLHDLAQAFSLLEVRDRLILLTIDFEKLSYAESAKFLNMSEKALKSRLHRARKKLASLLDETFPYSESS